jgi:hypothetical protein
MSPGFRICRERMIDSLRIKVYKVYSALKAKSELILGLRSVLKRLNMLAYHFQDPSILGTA